MQVYDAVQPVAAAAHTDAATSCVPRTGCTSCFPPVSHLSFACLSPARTATEPPTSFMTAGDFAASLPTQFRGGPRPQRLQTLFADARVRGLVANCGWPAILFFFVSFSFPSLFPFHSLYHPQIHTLPTRPICSWPLLLYLSLPRHHGTHRSSCLRDGKKAFSSVIGASPHRVLLEFSIH